MPKITPIDVETSSSPDWILSEMWVPLFQGSGDAKPYALIDGAVWASLIGDLQEVLEASGKPFCSLFQGVTAEEFGEESPFLVELDLEEKGAPTEIHRLLFDPGRSLALGFFFRSKVGIYELQKAFRKLTRVKDIDESWYYVRYWEPEYFIFLAFFLEGTRLLGVFEEVESFILPIEGDVVEVKGPFSPPEPAEYDREYELDRLFDAGAAMVAIRHARSLEQDHDAGCDSDTVYDVFRTAFSGYELDYSDLTACVDIVYVLFASYGAEASAKLTKEVMEYCFDETGEMKISFEHVHGQCMFALKHGLLPHRLPFEGGIK
ncbi:DUF4123 domain-containing protein [uncultured Litoreibacter sp.]|uniref:DUF4123 domain-containing protein n=1 Tax=uncultured Litoreibacter sp. TaxID=1392394 RepID=UPI0026337EB3|nr:DUF4123 domain-containing protein [uncultured Litoreibacter sp.]